MFVKESATAKHRALRLLALVTMLALCALMLSACGSEQETFGCATPKDLANEFNPIIQFITRKGVSPYRAYWHMISPEIRHNVYSDSFEVFEKENQGYIWDLRFHTWVEEITYVTYESKVGNDGLEAGTLTLLFSSNNSATHKTLRYDVGIIKIDGRWYLSEDRAIPVNP